MDEHGSRAWNDQHQISYAQAVLDATDVERGWECRWALQAEARVRELEARVKKLRRWASQAEAGARELEARVRELEGPPSDGEVERAALVVGGFNDESWARIGERAKDMHRDHARQILTAARSEGSDA
jgi:hypothetical protein